MQIAFLGTGLMGSGFVRRLRAQGHAVRVWNRTPAKARALEGDGIRAFADARETIAGAERIHLSLADDSSVDAVLEPLADAVSEGVWIVDHTTTAVAPTAERAARWAGRRRVYVHAPVFMGPANAADGTGLMLLSGAAEHCEALQQHLQTMTGKVLYLGTQPERAAAFKLFGNLAILGILGTLGDVNRLAHAVGIPTKEAFSLFEHFNPGSTLPQRAARIEARQGHTHPSFEMVMARKDLRLMIEEAQRGGVDLLMAPAVAALLDAGLARGEGALDVAAAARMPL
jgi:3-hydroxyisobutyrate dehydrogenase